MGSQPLRPCTQVAHLLRFHRQSNNLTLREVSESMAEMGEPLPISTLARIEQGKLDPGTRRLHLLMRFFDIPAELVTELVSLEVEQAEVPSGKTAKWLREKAKDHFEKGRRAEGLAHAIALLGLVSTDETSAHDRQDALLTLAVMASNQNHDRFAEHIIDQLLCEPPVPKMMWRVLFFAGQIWSAKGAMEVAVALTERAQNHVAPGDRFAYALILGQLGMFRHWQGALDLALENFQHAVRHFRAFSGRLEKEAFPNTLYQYSQVQHQLGQTSQAVRSAREACRIAAEQGFVGVEVKARAVLSRTYAGSGRFDEAEEVLQPAYGLINKHTDLDAETCSVYHAQRQIHLLREDPQAADAILQRVAPFVERCGTDPSPTIRELREALDEQAAPSVPRPRRARGA